MSTPDDDILRAWHDNAEPWARAIREHRIASRERVTNRAIVQAIRDLAPAKVLDVGCGEGWLTRTLADDGIDCLGIDAMPALIQHARDAGPGRYQVLSYEDLPAKAPEERFDLAVCNFSLLGDRPVARLLAALPNWLNSDGHLVIQTLHPGPHSHPDEDGWRTGSWGGAGPGFGDPAPWYYRSLPSWQTLLRDSGFRSLQQQEPRDPDTGDPVSILFIAQ